MRSKVPDLSKTELARKLGVSRSSLYYQSKMEIKDWKLKQRLEEVLRDKSKASYGHKRLADHLDINKKRVLRVMKIFGIKPYRRRGKKWRKKGKSKRTERVYPNLLLRPEVCPRYPDQIWVSDFTHIYFQGKPIYLATIEDLYTRKIRGFNILTGHPVDLVANALLHAVASHPAPEILHSDQGSEYASKMYVALAECLGIRISMSHPAAPWENGYQESFYSQFKVDLGDPNRFESLGELVYNIYRAIHIYNNHRIHTALRMTPDQYEKQLVNAVPS